MDGGLLCAYFETTSGGWKVRLNGEFKAALNQQSPSAYKDWNPGEPLPELPSTYQGKPVIDIAFMFSGCGLITSLDLSRWDTSNVKDLSYVFFGMKSIESLDLSNWNTGRVTDMYGLFRGCTNLSNLSISNWNTSNVNDMGCMFYDCINLKLLDLGGWNIVSADTNNMFFSCDN